MNNNLSGFKKLQFWGLLMFLPVALFAGTVTQTLEFNTRDIYITEANGFDVVQMPKYASMVEPGKPALPHYRSPRSMLSSRLTPQ
ncbi:MAG: hypothetical protein K6T77_01630 [candidate division WOR-3 bacterium]|nr:hypothetical protein [candidate division WOR-3 bacterium]